MPTEDLAIAIQWLVKQNYLEADDGILRAVRGTDVEMTYAMGAST
ncbi:hypothetical protein [Halorussus caseinilyticus]|uniref:Uncharacterized protein n=1 Tax=Halorussus caseinilyticus TaxID=3034025 RepID=A0ABD5WL58_9EURY